MGKYKLTVEATEDLYNIWEYTVNTWSEKQADTYYSKLKSAFEEIASNPLTKGKPYDHILPGLRAFHVEKHLIFFHPQYEGNVLIIRILHESMDFIRHF